LENPYVHLTNVAVQRKHREYNHKHGNKWSLANLRLYLDAARGARATDAMFASINEAIAHSLRSVQNAVVDDRRCFEVYGYDMLVDDDLKPWLVEVNASPSLSATTESDRALKTRVIRDALEVAAPAGWLEARQAELEAKRAGGVPRGAASSLGKGLLRGGGGASRSRREPTWRTEGGVPPSVAGSLDVLVDDAADELRERREREREGAKEARVRGGERVAGFGSSGRGRPQGPTR
jgi:tubulin polyglutamylase TTLL1